jgi:hypothetical protein
MIIKLFETILLLSLAQANMYWRDEKYEAAQKEEHPRVRYERKNQHE